MLALFLNEVARPFHETVSPLLKEPWRTAFVTEATKEADRAALFAEAAALVAARFHSRLPPAPNLRLVQVVGAGYDGIDLGALPAQTTLCNVFEHEPGVAEFALLAMLEWCHRLGPADAAVRAGDWSRSARFGGPPDDEIFGKTLAVVGFGRIGQAVAWRARAFGMRVVAVNRTIRPLTPELDGFVGLDRLHDTLAEADFVVLACALTPETTHLIDATALGAMKRSAVLVNVARGPIVDEEALWHALQDGRIAGAAIDTWWRYPTSPDAAAEDEPFPFKTLPNVLLSPHLAGWTKGTLERRTRFIAANLGRLERGEPLENVVRPGD